MSDDEKFSPDPVPPLVAYDEVAPWPEGYGAYQEALAELRRIHAEDQSRFNEGSWTPPSPASAVERYWEGAMLRDRNEGMVFELFPRGPRIENDQPGWSRLVRHLNLDRYHWIRRLLPPRYRYLPHQVPLRSISWKQRWPR